MPDITYDVGRVSFVMKGAWNLATSYEKLDAVSYNGSLYIAKQDVPGGTSITNTTYWQLAAEKGDKGDTGGVNSVNGQQGDIWFPDSRQLISDGYTTDTEPFLMKGNDSDSDRFELAKKLGNTVAVNQLVNPANYEADKTENGVSFEKLEDGRIKITVSSSPATAVRFRVTGYVFTNGHKYLLSTSPNYGNDKINLIVGSISWDSIGVGANGLYDTIWEATNDSYYVMGISVRVGCAVGTYYSRPIACDLDRWYGSRDRIPSDLLSHPENWGRYYAGSLAYNAGTLESSDGTMMKSIGRNQFDEIWESGYYDIADGTAKTGASWQRNANPVECLPNTAYNFTQESGGSFAYVLFYDGNGNYISSINGSLIGTQPTQFTTPPNASELRFYRAAAANTGKWLTISLYYSGESGYDTYYPYSVLAEVDTGSEVLRSAGAVADEKTPDGTITRRVGVVDLGTLTYYRTASGLFRTDNLIGIAKPTPTPSTIGNIMSASYTAMDGGSITGPDGATPSPNMVMAIYTTAAVYFNNTAYTDVAAFKTAMSGVYLYYELATPTTEQGTAFVPIVATVKCGVLSWTNTKGIPVGQESHWFENLRKRVEDRLPDPPSGDGTYRLTCTISGGVKTYSWEA